MPDATVMDFTRRGPAGAMCVPWQRNAAIGPYRGRETPGEPPNGGDAHGQWPPRFGGWRAVASVPISGCHIRSCTCFVLCFFAVFFGLCTEESALYFVTPPGGVPRSQGFVYDGGATVQAVRDRGPHCLTPGGRPLTRTGSFARDPGPKGRKGPRGVCRMTTGGRGPPGHRQPMPRGTKGVHMTGQCGTAAGSRGSVLCCAGVRHCHREASGVWSRGHSPPHRARPSPCPRCPGSGSESPAQEPVLMTQVRGHTIPDATIMDFARHHPAGACLSAIAGQCLDSNDTPIYYGTPHAVAC